MTDPGLEFFRAAADGEGEAMTMHAVHRMRKQAGGDG